MSSSRVGKKAELAAAEKARVTELAAKWDLKPVYSLAKKAKLPEAKFEVWNALVEFEATRGDETKAILAMMDWVSSPLTIREMASACSSVAPGSITACSW